MPLIAWLSWNGPFRLLNYPTLPSTYLCSWFEVYLFSSTSHNYAQFATSGATASELYLIVWTVVRQLEIAGFKVISLTCDGASPNCKFFKMHACSEESGLTYKVKHRYCNSSEERYIYFVSDVPHLLTTTRNCWSN